MLSPRGAAIHFLLALSFTAPGASFSGELRTSSTSRQFVVYGGTVSSRGAFCNLAERTKSNLLHLLQLRDNWKTSIIVRLDWPQANFPDAPPARLEVIQLGYGLKLQLNLRFTRNIRGRAVQRQLLGAILIEMIYRNRGDLRAGMTYVAPPDWLLDGVIGLQPGEDRASAGRLLQPFLGRNKIPALEEIVRQDRSLLDPLSRQLFEAYSQALLRLLLDESNGPRKLVRYLEDLAISPNDPMADLVVHFPQMLGRSPEKWWALSVAQLAASDRSELLSATQTSSRLNRLLHFSIVGRDGKAQTYSLGDFRRFRKLPGARAVLDQVSRHLLLLGCSAHPLYRSVVEENRELAQLLARGKTRHVAERLAIVAVRRTEIDQQVRTIGDYMNWYEATRTKTLSGAFTQILETADPGENNRTRRRDPISVYLDSIETEIQ
jgi:hypothetical protein